MTSPAALIPAGVEKLQAASEFQRVILSGISDARLVAEAVSFGGDETAARAALGALREIAPKLEHPLIETEVMRRRRATIVLDTHVHLRVDSGMRNVMGWSSYAAAPLVVEGDVIGLIHADHGENGRPVDALDRDVLWAFAVDFAQIYESTILRRALRRERDQARRFLGWIDARSGQLIDSAIELVVEEPSPLVPPDAWAVPATQALDDRIVFDALLTRRELDVLRLVARGLTNRAIAADLVMAEGTVKFHMNNILRKLDAANRAEAASRYLRMTGGGPASAR